MIKVNGSAANITSLTGNEITLSNLSGMKSNFVGKLITISNAVNPTNNGTFTISAYVSATSVKIINLNGVSPENNSSIKWSITYQVSGDIANITTKIANELTLTGLSDMESNFVGKVMAISGANSTANNGNFVISTFINSTSVKITNSNGIANDSNNGNIKWAVLLPKTYGQEIPITPFSGRLAVDRYEYQRHLEGEDGFNHLDSKIEVDGDLPVLSNPETVHEALENISNIFDNIDSEGEGFITVGGEKNSNTYNAWLFPNNAAPHFNSSYTELDTLLNPLFADIITNGVGSLTKTAPIDSEYLRIEHGGVIVIKAGVYIVKDSITVPPGISLIGEGLGTSIINGTSIDFNSNPPRPKTSNFSFKPVFIIAKDQNRSSTDSSGGSDKFIFTRKTVISNLIISDNFIEPPVSADAFYKDPQFSLNGSAASISAVTASTDITLTNIVGAESSLVGKYIVISNSSTNANNGTFLISAYVGAGSIKVANATIGTAIDLSASIKWGIIGSPLISQKAGSNLILDNVYLFGKAPNSTNYSSLGIQLDQTGLNSTGTYLSIYNSFISDFALPIDFKTIGGSNDTLEIYNSKIRGYGKLGNSTADENNCLVRSDDNNIIISNNYLFADSLSGTQNINSLVFINNVVGSDPDLQKYAKINISSNVISLYRSVNLNNNSFLFLRKKTSISNLNQRVYSLIFGNTIQNSTSGGVAGFEVFANPVSTSAELSIKPTEITIGNSNTTSFNLYGNLILNKGIGGFLAKRTLVTANYTIDSGTIKDFVIIVDTSLGSFNINLPAHVPSEPGRILIIKDGKGNASVNPINLIRNGGTGNIDDFAGDRSLSTNWGSWTLISDGTNWLFI